MSYALITGASSGIGFELAHIMAAKRHDLILVARTEDKLLSLKKELEAVYKVNAEVLAIDLSKVASAKKLYEHCKKKQLAVDCLVNNAGFGDYGEFNSDKVDRYISMLQLNVLCLTELTTLFVKDMKAQGKGRILNVGSIAAFMPMPGFAVYAASKAYVMQFTEALNFELRGTGISVTLLSPGVTETGFVSRANMGSAANAKKGLMDAKTVALAGYKAMMAGKLNVTPGWKNKLITFASKTTPSREVLLRIAHYAIRNTSKT